ncbi:MAG TPA: hypothetical protein VFE97_18350, partial [Methylomirabilota bacterium]|nr:hypothetical protein [Methylomirabilota bacterium]
PRVPNPGVLAVRVQNLAHKDVLISAEPAKFFTEPHYEGFPAVLVRLDAVSAEELEVLLEEAWRCQAPKALLGGKKPASSSARAKPASRKKAKRRKRT